MDGTDIDHRRRQALGATAAVIVSSTAGCLSNIEVSGQLTEESKHRRCYTESQSNLDERLAIIENVGVLDGEVYVELDEVAGEVASYRVFREGSLFKTFNVGEGSRLAWPAPQETFETSYQLVLRGKDADSLGSFRFSAECHSG